MAGALNVVSAQPGQIITDGLQLWLEPDLYASYPGSGTSAYDLSPNRYTWLEPDLYASYPGSGTSAYDLSPNRYTATLVNGVTYSTARAPSFGFNGATNYRYINTGQYLSSETFTLSSWFKSSTTSTYQMLFSKETTAGSPWNYRLFLGVTDGRIYADMTNGTTASLAGSTNLCNGVWHNAVFVRSVALDTLYLYVDGTLVTSITDGTSGNMANNQNVWIGLSAFTGASATGSYPVNGQIGQSLIYNIASATGSYPVNGQIGQSLIYNIALSATQVKQNFNAMRGVYGV